jgi:hypothetical protein
VSAYTPGPWAVEGGWNDRSQWTISAKLNHSGNDRGPICHTDGTPFLEQREANARLIHAAPAMYEALEAGYMLALRMPFDSLRIRNQAALCAMRDALAAATGRTSEDVQNDFEARAARAQADGKPTR